MDKYDELEKLVKLKESGALTQEEFDKEKTKLLNEDEVNRNTSSKRENNVEKKNVKEKKPIHITFKTALIVLLIGAGLFMLPFIINWIEESQKVQVPSIVGKTYEEAEKELKEIGLEILAKNGSSTDKNAIITKQYTDAGVVQKKGFAVNVESKTQEEIEKEKKQKEEAEAKKKKEEEERKRKEAEAKAKGYRKSPASQSTIISCAKTVINDILKSSSTAIWGEAEYIDQDNYGRCLVYVPLEAQNGFGGYSKLYYLVVLQYVEVDGHFTYKPYVCYHSLSLFGGGSPYNEYIGAYKKGKIYPVIQDFLDLNEWNIKPKNNS